MPINPEQEQYLRDHRLAALGTSKRDGSPQLTWIAYQFDGTDIVIQTGAASVKAKNIVRRPEVALLVPDGGRNLVVYGRAEVLAAGDERRAAIRRARAGGDRPATADDAALDAELDAAGSVALRITPDRAMGRIEERRRG